MRVPRPNEAVNRNPGQPESAESLEAFSSKVQLVAANRELFGALSETPTAQPKAQIIGPICYGGGPDSLPASPFTRGDGEFVEKEKLPR